MSLDFEAGDDAKSASRREDRRSPTESPRASGAAVVLDGTEIFARAAEERTRAATARAHRTSQGGVPGATADSAAPAAGADTGRAAAADVRIEGADARTAEQWFDIACELEAESPDEARRAYHRALELLPEMPEAHINLGRSYHEAKLWDKAEAHYRAAAESDPDDPIVWYNLGVLMEDVKRAHEAIIAYRHAIQRDADYSDAHYNLGLLLDALGRRTEAMTHLMRARELSEGRGST